MEINDNPSNNCTWAETKPQFLATSQPVLSHSALLSLLGRRSLTSRKHCVFCPHHHSHYRALYPENAESQPEASILTLGHCPGPGVNAYTQHQGRHITTHKLSIIFLYGNVKCNSQGKKISLRSLNRLPMNYENEGKLFCQFA